MDNLAEIGVVGLAVMGSNLARNIESRGHRVAVYNRTWQVTADFQQEFQGLNFYHAKELKDFVDNLKRPRKLIIMVKAGAPTDAVIDALIPLLSPDDLIIDGGNAWFQDTRRREETCKKHGVNFIGMGISGGEEGALKGPSTMPGGPKSAWKLVAPILEQISAKVGNDSCSTYIGPDGAGHFVKMVHNGIEYADMQLIAEAYHILQAVGGFSANELATVFANWNNGPLSSFLIEISAKIFAYKESGDSLNLVDLILDKAGQKGTGRWTSQIALELGVSAPTISSAVDARVLSSFKEERINASKVLDRASIDSSKQEKEALANLVESALYVGKIIAYAQGIEIMRAASNEYKWDLNIAEIASIWRGGCIIRASLLSQISSAYREDNSGNLLVKTSIFPDLVKRLPALRKVVGLASAYGVPTLALSSALGYYDSYRTENLPQNLTQAQRDFFGAHTFERKDKAGVFHAKWERRV